MSMNAAGGRISPHGSCQQRLGADDGAAVEGDLGLVEHPQLVVADRAAQIGDNVEPVGGEGLQMRLVDLEAAVTALLCPVARSVGGTQERLAVDGRVGRGADGDAGDDRQLYFGAVDVERGRGGPQHRLGQFVDVGETGAEHAELVAAHPCQHCVGSEGAQQPVGERHQYPVAGLVAEAVGDGAELVDVEQQQCGALVALVQHRQLLGDLVQEVLAVGEAGETVVGAAMLEFGLQGPVLAHVVADDGQAAHVAGGGTLRQQGELELERRSVGAGGGEIAAPLVGGVECVPHHVVGAAVEEAFEGPERRVDIGQAEHAARRTVRVEDPAAGLDDQDDLGSRVECFA
jgi:hypothetical protein